MKRKWMVCLTMAIILTILIAYSKQDDFPVKILNSNYFTSTNKFLWVSWRIHTTKKVELFM
jgi:hypothetical protein